MSGVVTSATQQGYLAEPHRPACGNCGLCDVGEGQQIGVCRHGGFGVMRDGWCPLWFATEGWIRQHRQVAAKLGVYLDQGPQTALEAAA